MDMGKQTPGTRIIAGPYDTAPPSVLSPGESETTLEARWRNNWERTDTALGLFILLLTLIGIAVSPVLVIAVWRTLL